MNLSENDNQYFGLSFLKQIILLFWGIWFSIAFITNFTDLLHYQYNTTLPFRSGNYIALEKVIAIYNAPYYFLNMLFLMDIFVQGISATLFLIAAFCWWKRIYTWQTVNCAFIISLSLWAVFLIMEEIFIAYSYEAVHIRLFIFELISLIAIHLLPPFNTRR